MKAIIDLRKLGFNVSLTPDSKISVTGHCIRTDYAERLMELVRANKDEAIRFLKAEMTSDAGNIKRVKGCFRQAYDFYERYRHTYGELGTKEMESAAAALPFDRLLNDLLGAVIKEIQDKAAEAGCHIPTQTALDDIGYEITDDEAKRMGCPW